MHFVLPNIWVLILVFSRIVESLNFNEINRVKVKKISRTRVYDNKLNNFKRQSDNEYHLLNFVEEELSSPNSANNSKATPYLSQLKKIRSLSKNVIVRIQNQIEKNRHDLSECHQQIGKYTRLMVANNARNQLNKPDQKNFESESSFISVKNLTKANLNGRIFIYNELSFYLLVVICFNFVLKVQYLNF